MELMLFFVVGVVIIFGVLFLWDRFSPNPPSHPNARQKHDSHHKAA